MNRKVTEVNAEITNYTRQIAVENEKLKDDRREERERKAAAIVEAEAVLRATEKKLSYVTVSVIHFS